MTYNTQQIALLVQRFFAGETTVAEEQQLCDFFASADVPASLALYAPLFRDLAQLSPSTIHPQPSSLNLQPSTFNLPPSTLRRVAAAVAVLLIMGGGFWGYQRYQTVQWNRLYEGSYMIVNGVRTDDPSAMRAQIEQTMSHANALMAQANATQQIDDIKADLLDGIDDPAQRQQIEALFQ